MTCMGLIQTHCRLTHIFQAPKSSKFCKFVFLLLALWRINQFLETFQLESHPGVGIIQLYQIFTEKFLCGLFVRKKCVSSAVVYNDLFTKLALVFSAAQIVLSMIGYLSSWVRTHTLFYVTVNIHMLNIDQLSNMKYIFRSFISFYFLFIYFHWKEKKIRIARFQSSR